MRSSSIDRLGDVTHIATYPGILRGTARTIESIVPMSYATQSNLGNCELDDRVAFEITDQVGYVEGTRFQRYHIQSESKIAGQLTNLRWPCTFPPANIISEIIIEISLRITRIPHRKTPYAFAQLRLLATCAT